MCKLGIHAERENLNFPLMTNCSRCKKYKDLVIEMGRRTVFVWRKPELEKTKRNL